MKQYGDEDFIYLIKEEAEAEQDAGQEHVNQITDGFIIIDGERILMEDTPVSEDEFSMILPVMFEPMDESLAKIKYPSENRPDFILSSPDTTITANFSHKKDLLEDGEVEEFKNIIQETIMKVHPSSKVIESNTVEVDGHKIAYFDFITPAIDSEIYNLMFFFSLKDRLLMGAFNCLKMDMHDWKDIFMQMLHSVRFL